MKVIPRSETDLQIVARHVRESVLMLEQQHALIAGPNADRLDTVAAESVLGLFEPRKPITVSI